MKGQRIKLGRLHLNNIMNQERSGKPSRHYSQ